MPEDLRQADLSHLAVKDMTPEQRAELRRRYDEFVKNVVRAGERSQKLPGPAKKLRKWVPGMKG
jgi:hypothetical protein